MLKKDQNKIKFLFKNISDPRVNRTKYYSLESILYIVICATMAGIDDFVGCADYAENNFEELSKIIDLSNGVPSHDTIGRVISLLDVDDFYQSFDDFVNMIVVKFHHVVLNFRDFYCCVILRKPYF